MAVDWAVAGSVVADWVEAVMAAAAGWVEEGSVVAAG